MTKTEKEIFKSFNETLEKIVVENQELKQQLKESEKKNEYHIRFTDILLSNIIIEKNNLHNGSLVMVVEAPKLIENKIDFMEWIISKVEKIAKNGPK